MKKIILTVTTVALLLTSSLASSWWWSKPDTYTKTQHPIVLVHGISGFDSIGGVLDYFHTIPYNLERSGAKVYVASVSAFNSSEIRGQQLADYLVTLPEEKFNLIGHSQGSPTSRVAAALVPNKVVSVTSVNGVNAGSAVADVVLGVVPEGVAQSAISNIANSFGNLISLLSDTSAPQDGLAGAVTLSTAGTAALNAALDWDGISQNCSSISEDTNVGGYNIKMFSWTGNTAFTNIFDATDYALAATAVAFAGEANDGLTSVCSAKLGKVIGSSYNLNHADAINHLFGVTGWTNPVTLFRSHANRLKNKNL